MAEKTRKEALDEAVNRLLEEENIADRTGPNCYSKVIWAAFDEICLLLGQGVKFVRICKSFELSGMLPENANVHCFRQAFHRERKRRNKGRSTIPLEKKSEKTLKKLEPPKLDVKPAPNSNPGKSIPDDETARRERIQRMTGNVVDTGLGTIVKHTDGSFDYD